MTRQDQKVAEGGVALQAAGNATYNAGLNAEQMSEIIVALGVQLGSHFASAERTIERRLEQMRQKLLEEFTTPGRAAPAAFTDPDFQKVVSEAQETFVRSGDDNVANILVQIVSARSQCKGRDRLALSLNQAVETSGSLTSEEFSALTFIFAFTRMHLSWAGSNEGFADYMNRFVLPSCVGAGRSSSSFEFMLSHQCISINTFPGMPFHSVINNGYGGLFAAGFTEQELISHFTGHKAAEELVRQIISPVVAGSDKLKFLACNTNELEYILNQFPVGSAGIKISIDLMKNSYRTEEDLVAYVEGIFPAIRTVESYWNNTRVQYAQLTALGIAIGHANLKRLVPNFESDLSIWIS